MAEKTAKQGKKGRESWGQFPAGLTGCPGDSLRRWYLVFEGRLAKG